MAMTIPASVSRDKNPGVAVGVGVGVATVASAGVPDGKVRLLGAW